MTPEGEFHCEKNESWLIINSKIPNHSWVCDPEVDSDSEFHKCGVRHSEFTSKWQGREYSEFPPEFKTYLLLMGVTL